MLPDQWRHAVAGCTAGISTVLALQPLDVIKTRLQVQDGAAAAGVFPIYKGTVDALQHMVKEEGWRALYSGLTPALVGSGMAWGIYFFTYNHAKKRYQGADGKSKLNPAMHLISAAEAGAVVCFATNPVWVAKTRLQLQYKTINQMAANATAATGSSQVVAATQQIAKQSVGAALAAGSSSIPKSPPMYSGFLDCLTQIARTEGIRGLYKGLLPSLLLVSHGAIQFAVYEELKELATGMDAFITPLSADKGNKNAIKSNKGKANQKTGTMQTTTKKRQLTSAEITACGALSKLAASVTTYPSQVIRSRLQQRMDSRVLKYSGILDVMRKTMAREGVRGFYKGLVPNVLRVMPQSAITFLVYESVMRQLEKV